MRVDIKLLRDWGFTCAYLEQFERDYPDGVEGTIAELAQVPPHKFARLDFLVECAARLDGADAQEAADLLEHEGEPSRLANVVERCKGRLDVSRAEAAVLASGDEKQIARVRGGRRRGR
jgi:hypothetical protein